jgi:phage tail-like protein
MDSAIRYAVLRSGEAWPGVALDGLERSRDGTLELARVPAVGRPFRAPPGPVAPSGLALDDDCGLFVADTAGNRVVRVALDCLNGQVLGGRTAASSTPGVAEFDAPAGLCVGPFGWLFVADAGSGRILVFTRPELARRAVWTAGLSEPVAVAADGDRAVVVADRGLGRVLRLDPEGRPDAGFNARLAPPAGPRRPRGVAVGSDGTVYVTDDDSRGVRRFDRTGQPAGDLLAAEVRPQAIAVAGAVLYVADAGRGEVLRFALPEGRALGAVWGFQGPVAALAADADGRVWIKPGLDDEIKVADPGAARLARGTLSAGPLDAGEEAAWARVLVHAEAGAATAVRLETALGLPAPAATAWRAAAALDTLLQPSGRHLWVRVTLERRDDAPEPAATPGLHQVQAETPGDDYADYLPAVYTRQAEQAGFLRGLLGLARSELGGLEDVVAGLPRLADPAVAPRAWLAWLAAWQGFDIPARLADDPDADRLRAFVARLPELAERRGTPTGLWDLVEAYTGARVLLVEAFRSRGVWTLGERSRLGVDSMLPARSVDGVVIDESVLGASGPEDPARWGAALFADWAHRFTVLVPAGAAPTEEQRRQVVAMVDRERPAHTICHVCFVEPRLRVGVQSQVGVDAVVAAPAGGGWLDGRGRLGVDVRTAAQPLRAASADRSQLGIGPRVG